MVHTLSAAQIIQRMESAGFTVTSRQRQRARTAGFVVPQAPTPAPMAPAIAPTPTPAPAPAPVQPTSIPSVTPRQVERGRIAGFDTDARVPVPTPSPALVAPTPVPDEQRTEFTQAELGLNIPAEFLREGTIVPVGDRRFRISPTGTLIQTEGEPPIIREQQPVPTAEPTPEPAAELPVTEPLVQTPEQIARAESAARQLGFASVEEMRRSLEARFPTTPEEDREDLAKIEEEGVTPPTQEEFDADPFSTIKDIMKQIFEALDIGRSADEFQSIADQIEELENQRDEEIAVINDNPFISESLRSKRVARATKKFEDKIDSRINKLRLLEGVMQREQNRAEFVAKLALNVFDKQRQFDFEQFKFAEKQALDELKAERDLIGAGELTEEIVGGFRVLRDATGKVISTRTVKDVDDADDFSAARQFLADNPDASRADLKAALLENTNLNTSEINAILDGAGVIKEKISLTEDQLRIIVRALIKANTKRFRGGEFERTKEQIEAGVLEINKKKIELSQRQISQLLEMLNKEFPKEKRGFFARVLPGGK